MKATVLALALLCAGVASAQTSAPASASTREAQHMNDLATLLDLTDAQKAQVQPILEAEHAQMKQAFEQAKASGTKPDFQQMNALRQQVQQETLQKLTPVLSALQLKKFQVLMSHMHGHPHFHKGGPAAAAAPPASSN